MRTSNRNKMKNSFIAAASLLGLSNVALADPPWVRYGYGYEQPHYGRRCHEPRVVEQNYYYYPQQPQGYAAPPPVVYQQAAPVYQYQYPQQSYGNGYYRSGGGYGQGDRLLSSALLGAAGGFIGSHVGHGDGRAAATAAGAVAGWLLGNRVGGW